ncbi:MAG: hypothetical protein ABI679_01710 [Gemmatimonadota bacterium]
MTETLHGLMTPERGTVTLPDVVAHATGLDRPTAEVAAGSILGALRISAPKEAFTPFERAIPNYQQMILGAGTVIGGGRTGEIIALVSELRSNAGVLKLAAQLGRAGVSPIQVGQAAQALIEYVRQHQGPESVRPLLDALPGFRELVQ